MEYFIYISIVFSIVFSTTDGFAHKRAKYNVVIDTDGGVDDLRALTYFMASRDFNINAITTVDGVLPPKLSAQYVQALCSYFHHEGIRVGQGTEFGASKKYFDHAIPVWQNLFSDISEEVKLNSVDLLISSIQSENKRTIVVAMGPLTNIAEALANNPELCPLIENILWYSDYNQSPQGYNFEQDEKAFYTLQNLKVPIKCVHSTGEKYDQDFFDVITDIENVYTKAINKAFAETKFIDNGMYYWDEFLPLYLLYPSMFNETVVADYIRKISPQPKNYFDVLVTGILNFDKPDQGVSFNEIPTYGGMLRSDVASFSDTILFLHGYAEFKIISLTNEIHSHMGIYSILGAKTGLRIMEYLHAGLDEIFLVSFAGYNPPVSCFNDGLQVGTGSTIGYGTISVAETAEIMPRVIVKYNGREIIFTLKDEVIAEIKNDVGHLIKTYGLESELYWIKLREISIEKYWLGMSRYDILEIEEK
jgi:pyrimidine-specific ribonucleoside hydrolase